MDYQGKTDGLERSTLEQYGQHLNLHITPYIGRVRLADLKPAHVQRLRDQLIASGRSRDMARRVIVSLGALLTAAMSYGKLPAMLFTTKPAPGRPASVGLPAGARNVLRLVSTFRQRTRSGQCSPRRKTRTGR